METEVIFGESKIFDTAVLIIINNIFLAGLLDSQTVRSQMAVHVDNAWLPEEVWGIF